jgi:hypothetical protein
MRPTTMRDQRQCECPTYLVEIVQLGLAQLRDVWGQRCHRKIHLDGLCDLTCIFVYDDDRFMGCWRRRRLALTLCVHTAYNRPFTGSDGTPKPESDDSDGSCIVLVGDTGTASKRPATAPL